MPMLRDPSKKYQRFTPLHLPDRQWPDKTTDKPPRWLATDLRDGNQSLPDPMDSDQKYRFFQKLVEIGYKEIEVSFPSASEIDFDFTRRLVETPGAVPDDVWLQVLSQCREDLIRRTVDSLKGAKKAILHLYLATSECFRQIVFGFTEEETVKLAVECTRLARSLTKDDPSQAGTAWAYEFSPETFSDTSPQFVVRVCEAVKAAWEPTEANPIIFNLPSTVEMAPPNVYADQIEYFCRNISERSKVCVSLHTHNDRGCAVAAAEQGLKAGADRVEGTLFGNGERTGNVDLVILALNLYRDGISPNVDFSDMKSAIELYEECTKLRVPERSPYSGEFVFCAFSGSHQDAISKGFQARGTKRASSEAPWQIPYLPLDPEDFGRSYEAVIRVNSQSGKGGAAWVIDRNLSLELPRGLKVAFSKIVQKESEKLGRELKSKEVLTLFENAYHLKEDPYFVLVDYTITVDRSMSPIPPEKGRTQNTKDFPRRFDGIVAVNGEENKIHGVGNGPISSLANALKQTLGIDLDVGVLQEHSIDKDRHPGAAGADSKAAAYMECTVAGKKEKIWGVGIHADSSQAGLLAFFSAATSFVLSSPDWRKPILAPSPKRTKYNGINSLPVNGSAAPSNGLDAVSKLEARVNGV